MAPKARQIQQRTRTARFDIEGDEWVVHFRPFSSDTLRAAMQGDESEQYDGICRLLGQTVTGWNLEGDDGEPLPVEGAGMTWLRSVGLDYVQAILDGILEEIKVGKLSGSDSSAGLRRVV
jgi:hypothetical protein